MISNHTRGARYFPSLIMCGVTTIIRRTCATSRSLELLLQCSIAARFSLCQALPSFHSVFYSRSPFPTVLEPGTGQARFFSWLSETTTLFDYLKALPCSHNLSTE